MAINYTWKIVAIKKVDAADLKDAVIGIRWEKIGVDSEGVEGKFNGSTPFKLSEINKDNYIDWNNLTEAVVVSWVKSAVLEYEDQIDTQILKQIRDKRATGLETSNMPWDPDSANKPELFAPSKKP